MSERTRVVWNSIGGREEIASAGGHQALRPHLLSARRLSLHLHL